MKTKKFFAFSLVITLLLSFLCVSATASFDGSLADGADDVANVVNAINASFSGDEFGGIYYDGDILVVNVVAPTDFGERSSSMRRIDSGMDVEYRTVRYSLQELEEVKNLLTPVMDDFGISILDANEITNQVDIFLKSCDAKAVEEIKAYVAEKHGPVEFLNFVDQGNKVLISTVADRDFSPAFDSSNGLVPDEAGTARTRYFSGAEIRIGNGFYTLGPALSSSKAYSAGHKFQGTVSVYDINGMQIGNATSHFGGSSGDWSSVNIYGADYYPVVGRGTPISGTRIYMFGAASGETTGRIDKTNVSVSVDAPYATLTGMCSGTYSCGSGDSGAGIFSQSISDLVNSSNGVTYGIQSSGLFYSGTNEWAGESFFTPISKVY